MKILFCSTHSFLENLPAGPSSFVRSFSPDRAKKKTGDLRENFLQLLEMRLDNVVYRAGLAKSRSQARQLVNHGHFIVNDKKVTIASFLVKSGDIIKIKSTKQDSKYYKNIFDSLKKQEKPGWINFETDKKAIKVLHAPTIEVIKPNFEVQQIIEYYSK